MTINEKLNRLTFLLKLLVAFVVGFLLWKCALLGLDWVVQQLEINSLWVVVLSRFALLGYFLPFLVWFHFEPQKIYTFSIGDIKASIQMPFIWYGLKDSVIRVCVVFSLLCLVLTAVLFYVKQLSVAVLLAGFAFAIVNSILEEFLWRGLILRRTAQMYGEKLGLILMSLIFGLYHYPLGFSLPICLVFSLGGIYFGGITIRSKGLLLGTVMHISMNLFFVAIGIIF